ncbi:MAG: alpha-ketoglutarate-dependent dioxygenase AlkB [Actinomycetota bacterium]
MAEGGAAPGGVALQGSLWAATEPDVDESFATLVRHPLRRGAWVDHQPDWVSGADTLFDRVAERFDWHAGRRWMYEREVDEPRLTARLEDGDLTTLPVLPRITAALGRRYGTTFPGCWANFYRDGRDSVAWHGDRVARERLTALVVIVSLGERRRFLLRPAGGGPSTRFDLGRGDLLVMGGTCQRTWQHAVPKSTGAGPRISLTFRPPGQSTSTRPGRWRRVGPDD